MTEFLSALGIRKTLKVSSCLASPLILGSIKQPLLSELTETYDKPKLECLPWPSRELPRVQVGLNKPLSALKFAAINPH